MAAERPENAEERLVADALQKAFGGPVPPAAFVAGRDAVLAAAALSAEEVAADTELVTAALENAFAVALAPEVRAGHVAAIHAAAEDTQDAQKSNVIPLRRFGQQVGRHAAAVAVAVSTLAGGSGVAAASTDALPGQMLYPVKRAVEQVMLTAAWTPTAEARVQTQLAARRLDEAEQLLASGASPELVGPLLSEYDEHVAVVEGLAITSATVEVAVLEEKADALREQAIAAGDDTDFDDAALAAVPTETTSPAAVTTTEPPTADASEASTSDDDEQAEPAPAASSTSAPKPASEPASTSSGTSGGGTTTTTQPAPTSGTSPSPSPSPSPTVTPTPNRPPQSDVDESKKPAPGQQKPKPNKPEPTPTSSPTVNPDRAPLSDNEPVYDSGPLAEWEEQSFVDGS